MKLDKVLCFMFLFSFRPWQCTTHNSFCSYFSSTKRSSYYAIEGVSPWVVQSSDCGRNIYRFYFGLSVLHDPNSTTSTLAEANLDVTRSISIRSRSTTYRWKRSSDVAFFPCGVTIACSRLSVIGDERKHGQEKKMREDYSEAGREGLRCSFVLHGRHV